MTLKAPNWESLKVEYDKVSELTWQEPDFLDIWLRPSCDLFTVESLLAKNPIPKALEVFALLSGLQFSKKLQYVVGKIQDDISQIIGPAVHYWVKTENLGVEYCVFKWPNDRWDANLTKEVSDVLANIKFVPFDLYIRGLQINRDGCVVLRGYDENQSVFKLRKKMRDSLKFLPEKQSNWVHIPIGRILQPLGSFKFNELRGYVERHKNIDLHVESVGSAKFVHETQWYMERHFVIQEVLPNA